MPVNKTQIDSFRKRIAKDRLEEVIDELLTVTKSSSLKSVRSWQNHIIALKADFRSAEQAFNGGELSPAEYNAKNGRLRRRTLELLDDLAAEKSYTPPVPAGSESGRKTWPYLLLGGVLAACLGWWFWPEQETAAVTEIPGQLCPEFETDQDFNILVLPYTPLIGDEPNGLHRQVTRDLAAFAKNYSILVDTRASGLAYNEIDNYPILPEDADLLGRECGGDLVIWGEVENSSSENHASTSYRFVDIDDWGIEQLQLTEQVQLASAPSFLEISNSGQLTANIKTELAKLFSIIAGLRSPQMAIRAIEENMAEPEDGEIYELQQLMLAQAYQNSGQEEKAISTYDNLIVRSPNNLLAWQNRGTLKFATEDYEGAAEDLGTVLEENPEHEQVRYTRAMANLRAGHIRKAEEDVYFFDRPQTAVPDSDTSDSGQEIESRPARVQKINATQIEVLQNQVIREQALAGRHIDAARIAVQQSGGNTNLGDLKAGMTAAYETGNYREAAIFSERILKEEPRNTTAFKIAAESLNQLGDRTKVESLINLAEERGLQQQLQLRIQEPLRADTAVLLPIRIRPNLRQQ